MVIFPQSQVVLKKLYNMRFLLSIFLSFVVLFSQAQDLDSLTYKEKLYSGEFPPYIKLTNEDKIQLPVEFFVELNIDEISDVDIKNNFFYTKFYNSIYTRLDTLEITKNNQETYWYPGVL